MDDHNFAYVFVLVTIFILSTKEAAAQQTGDDFKMKLRQSLKSNLPGGSLKPDLKFQPQQIEQYEKDVLKVGPTTKLPTKYDGLLNLPLPPEPNIEMNVTNRNSGPVTDKIDYSTKKLLPDAVPSSLQSKIHRPIGPNVSIEVGDFDPVRAIQAYKRAKRQEKINKIKKAYGQ